MLAANSLIDSGSIVFLADRGLERFVLFQFQVIENYPLKSFEQLRIVPLFQLKILSSLGLESAFELQL